MRYRPITTAGGTARQAHRFRTRPCSRPMLLAAAYTDRYGCALLPRTLGFQGGRCLLRKPLLAGGVRYAWSVALCSVDFRLTELLVRYITASRRFVSWGVAGVFCFFETFVNAGRRLASTHPGLALTNEPQHSYQLSLVLLSYFLSSGDDTVEPRWLCGDVLARGVVKQRRAGATDNGLRHTLSGSPTEPAAFRSLSTQW